MIKLLKRYFDYRLRKFCVKHTGKHTYKNDWDADQQWVAAQKLYYFITKQNLSD